MGIKARAEYTVSVVNDGKGEKTYIRYSDDNGKTFTKSKLNHIIGDIATSVVGENRSGQVAKQWSFNRFDTGEVLLCALVEMSGNTTESPSMYFQAQPNGGVGGWDVIRTPWTNLQNGVQVLQAVCTLPNSMTDNGILNMRLDNVDGTIKVHDLTLMYRSDVKGTELTQDNMFLSGKETGKYIGIMSWDKENPPLDPSAYTWSEFKGQDAEMYKLNPLEESAVIGEYGECNIDLQYEIKHVVGNKETKYTGNDITISVDNRVNEIIFMKTPAGSWECRVSIVDFTKKNLGSFLVNIKKGQQVLDTRVVPVTYNTNVLLEASQKLGEVVASVKGVSKLIHNMFVGSTFLEPTEGAWGMVGAAVDKGVKYNGSNVVLIQNIGATQDSYHGVYFFIEGLVPQKKYTISAMVLTNNLTEMDRGAAIEIKMTDNGQDVRLCDPFPIVLTKENEWQKVEFTFTTPDRITSEKVQVRFQLWRNGHLWISQPMMNAGEVAADYTANIKDIQLSLAQIKVTANTISQSVTDLSTGIEQAGIHLDGANSEITLKADKTKFVDRDGKMEVFIKDGKLNAKAIDADKVVAEGIQSKTIDAKDATFENVNIKGVLDSVSGTFKVLKCVDKDGKEIATLRFGNQGTLTIEGGDLFMQGMKIDRNLRFYASDIWCRGAFGAAERTVMVVKGSKADCYINGVKKEPITVSFDSLTGSDGRTYYKIPCYSPGYMMGLGTSGFPVDTVLFNISDTDNHFFELDMYETQRCMVINANDDADNIYIYSNGKPVEWKGGEIAEVLQLPLRLTNPEVSMNIVGAGTIIGAFRDNDW